MRSPRPPGGGVDSGLRAHSLIPSALSTLARSLRLPTTLAAGEGDSLARCGVTRMPSASARIGNLSTSMISSLKASCRCSLQIAWRLAIALTEFGAASAMYRRITTTVMTARRERVFSAFLRRIAFPLLVLLSGISRAAGGTARRVRATDPAQLLLPLARGNDARLILSRVQRQLGPLPHEILRHA